MVGDQMGAFEATILQVSEESAPAVLGFLGTLTDA
jgi:hypothetical protein